MPRDAKERQGRLKEKTNGEDLVPRILGTAHPQPSAAPEARYILFSNLFFTPFHTLSDGNMANFCGNTFYQATNVRHLKMRRAKPVICFPTPPHPFFFFLFFFFFFSPATTRTSKTVGYVYP